MQQALTGRDSLADNISSMATEWLAIQTKNTNIKSLKAGHSWDSK